MRSYTHESADGCACNYGKEAIIERVKIEMINAVYDNINYQIIENKLY